MSTRALTGTRLLTQPIPSYQGLFTDGTGWTGTNDWLPIDGATATGVYHEAYFDLSGYELDDLTLVPTAIALQDGLPYLTSNGADPQLFVQVLDIVSQERLTPSEVYTLALTGDYPGSPGSSDDWTQILKCDYRLMLAQTTFTSISLLLTATGGSFGSSEPTAVQKLWTYRIVITGGLDWSDKTISIPATRFVLGAEIIQESELEYMMRLKRSYELQG